MSVPPPSALPAAAASFAQGVAAQQAGDLETAAAYWRQALTLDPAHEGALYNLGVAEALAGRTEEAAAAYERLLAHHPAHRDGLFNLANLRKTQDRDADALQLYAQLVQTHPAFASGWVNQAKALSDRGCLDAAEASLREALRLEPDHVWARWNLAVLLLRQKKWLEGWEAYEARRQLPHWMPPPVDASAWTLPSPARRVLLWNDQGFGDAIQFLRYARLVAAQGCEVHVMAQAELKNLARHVSGVHEAWSPEEPVPAFDAQAPLSSLPFLLNALDPASAGIGAYITPKNVLPLPETQARLKVGLVWAGNPNYPNDAARSLPLAALAPLAALPDIAWFSLQFGAAAEQRVSSGWAAMEDVTPRLRDFADTASALAALDLVICVDTAVAHLAGAMGKPCWILLPKRPDWRWEGTGASSEWYASVRLFRPKAGEDRASAIAELAQALRTFEKESA